MHRMDGFHDGVLPTCKQGFCSSIGLAMYQRCYVVWFFLKKIVLGVGYHVCFFLVFFLRIM